MAPDSAATTEPEVRGLGRPIAWVGKLIGRLFFWAPVVFAFAFLAQASLKGLKPAMAEGDRLADEAVRMQGVHEGLVSEQDELERRIEAYDDPIHQERERRLLLQRDQAPTPVDSPTPWSNQPAGGGTASGPGGGGTPAPTPGGPTVR